MSTRTFSFTGRDGTPVTITRTVRDQPSTTTLDRILTRRRLSSRERIEWAACPGQRSAQRVAMLCRTINPENEYRVTEYPGWGWVVKERCRYTSEVATVTHLGELGVAGSGRGPAFLEVSDLADLTLTATFSY